VVLLIILFSRINVQRVEFSLISWLHCIGVGARLLGLQKINGLVGIVGYQYKIVLNVGLCFLYVYG
jgi:hypothetical protein